MSSHRGFAGVGDSSDSENEAVERNTSHALTPEAAADVSIVDDENPDEGEGDDVADSSEESSDDEEEAARVREGFIVDEDEEEESSGPKKKKRRRHQHDADLEALEDDDLELVREAAGDHGSSRPESSKFKRLKRAGGEANEGRGLEAMFSDEDDEEAAENAPGRGEFDDFIEEDEFSDDEEARRRQEELETATATRRGRTKVGGRKLDFAQGLDEDKVNEIYEVFGDGEQYDWALEGEEDLDSANPPGLERDEGSDEDETERGVKKLDLKDVFEPSELQERMLTTEDNAIRAEDVPERYQLRRNRLKHGYELDELEAYEKKTFVADAIYEEKKQLLKTRPELREALRNAIYKVVEYVDVDNLEVPFIWHHRQDYLVEWQGDERVQLLNRGDLWRLLDVIMDFYAMREKRIAVRELWASLNLPENEEFDAQLKAASSLVEYQDLLDWIQFAHSESLRQSSKSERRHARFGVYDRIRASPVYRIAVDLDLTAVPSSLDSDLGNSIKDPTLSIAEAVKEYSPDTDREQALAEVVDIAAMELSQNTRIRRWFRQAFEDRARVDLVLTEDGRRRIDEFSQFADIKYAANWSFDELRLRPELFLRMLAAEEQGLVVVRVQYPNYKSSLYEDFVAKCTLTNSTSEWNDLRRRVAKEVSRRVVPLVCRNIREHLRMQCARILARDVRDAFAGRLDQAPYKPPGYVFGTTPRTMTLSAGMAGHTDAVLAVFLDEEGRLVEHAKLGDDRSSAFQTEFLNMIERNQPDVIGVAGLSPKTRRIFARVSGIVSDNKLTAGETETPLAVLWVQDEVARLYLNTQRAAEEFPQLVPNARYCVALARYLQNPLLEYAALGTDMLKCLPIHVNQALLNSDELSWALDTTFVDYVNMVGVDLNLAARSAYNAAMLPYVAGLGPRKASHVLQVVQSRGGLQGRTELVTEEITTAIVFMNCASFLKFPLATSDDGGDQLDATRIHPEDYELARKMCADALELDEEDVAAVESRGGGGVVGQLIEDESEARKLDDLVLEEYAEELEVKFHRRKRCTLGTIRSELQDNYHEMRHSLVLLSDATVFTMLTGESEDTLHTNSVVSAVVRRATGRQLLLTLSSGVDAVAESGNMSDDRSVSVQAQFQPGQAVQAVVLHVDYKSLFATVSTRARAVADAIEENKRSRVVDRTHWNQAAEDRDEAATRAKIDQEMRQGRVIKHPLFRPFTSKQAEEYLAPLQRGDLVIRPSSRGMDHLVITWKVAEQIYQHIDVLELDKANDFAVGRTLQIGQYKYSDLDELIIMHIQAMARKVDEMTQSEKFQAGNRGDVEKWLTAYTNARPNQSVYAFCFDHRRPGYFLLCFKTGSRSSVKEWHVKVIPNGYELMRSAYPDVPALCNGFKLIFQNMQRR